MGLFDKIKEPVFLKEDSAAKAQLAQLEALLPHAPKTMASQIEQDIKNLKAGIVGEDRIAFELRNSHIPMFVLHDLYLSHGDLSAQIDFLVITRKRYFVIECKNLYGNIEINNAGDFVRTVTRNGRTHKEGMYSPITQNTRHLELIKQLRGQTKGNILTKALFEKYFYDNYRSVVVLANPNTILNAKYAKKEVKQQVIRADQLIEYIKRVQAEPGVENSSEQEMENLATFFLTQHVECPMDYTAKYRETIEKNMPKVEPEVVSASEYVPTLVLYPLGEPTTKPASQPDPQPTPEPKPAQSPDTIVCPKCGAPMVKRKAAKGANAGNEFYGCSAFPKCRSIVNIK
ncbi:NERD domain-containing protein [Oscillibacter sp.]|uniref:NERD domain-containing protein n=1 Tax=Oscillibacter sp. TaxID=1945593 RepID=UPI00289902CC|nr:NERD domain-containing protein [Oscillibacter sp.]